MLSDVPDGDVRASRSAQAVRRFAVATGAFVVIISAAAVLFAPFAARREQAKLMRCGARGMEPSRIAALRATGLVVPNGRIVVRIADSPAERLRGLMCVPSVPHGYGLLFAFPATGGDGRRFWMKNTRIPLDLVFVSADGAVTGVAARVTPPPEGTPDAELPVIVGTGRYVLELPAGDADTFGIVQGGRIDPSPVAALAQPS